MWWILGALAAVIGFVGAPVAQATIVVATYSGTVSSGSDGGGLFGSAGANLAGDAFDVVFTFDTSLGMPTPDGYEGGDALGDSSPLLTVSLTIAGATFTSNDWSVLGQLIDHFQDFKPKLFVSDSDGIGAAGRIGASFLVTPETGSLTSTSPDLVGTVEPMFCPDQNRGGCGFFNLDGGLTTGILNSTTVEVSPYIPTGLPEPKTWALLIAGLSILGAALRRRYGVTLASGFR